MNSRKKREAGAYTTLGENQLVGGKRGSRETQTALVHSKKTMIRRMQH